MFTTMVTYKEMLKNQSLENFGFIGWNEKKFNPRGKTKMVSIRQTALMYEAQETKNISELQKFSVDLDIETVEYTKDDGTTFSVNETNINNEKYRVPNQVLKQLKTLLQDNPNIQEVKVLKDGSGLKTSYQVVTVQ